MLRVRGSALAQALRHATNGVIGIRREDKNEWERRVPLTPDHVSELVYQGFKVIVQPSSIRAFSDDEYEEAGATINEDLSEAQTILAVKEVPVPLLIPNTTYMMFSHTHKAQTYNMPLLDAILANNIRLIDFERIASDEGRIVKFGPFAGFAGTIDTLHALGLALLSKHFATPFLHISHAKEYRSLEAARADLIDLGNFIRKRGLPRELGPLTFVVTGSGSVSQAAQQILHHLPCQYVDASELKNLCAKESFDNKTIYVTVVSSKDMVSPKDRTRKFDKADYYKNPENYEPTFHEDVAPYAKVIINGMYWEEKYPRLLTIDQTRRLAKKGQLPLLVLGEITCDPYGSIEFFTKSTSIAHPLYCYDPLACEAVDMEKFKGQGPLIVGVDHLPAEFPAEASQFFGDPLVSLVKEVAKSDINDSLEAMQKQLPAELYNGILTSHGKLTPNYEYIADLRKAREDEKHRKHNRNILFLGAGMVSGPAVEYLLKDPRNSITLADMDVHVAEEILEQYAGDAAHAGRDVEGKVQAARAVALDVSNKQNLEALVHQADVVISLVPWMMHPQVMEICIDAGVPCVTASYVSPGIEALNEKAKAAGVTLLNEMGLDPGIDIMSTMQMLHDIKTNGGIVRSYESYCGALPEPEASRNCLGYKFSWSPKGVLIAAQRPCTFKWAGDVIDLQGSQLYDVAQPFTPFRGLHMEWVPNGNSLGYLDTYGLHDAHTVVRATLRYQGFSTVAKAMRELNLLNHDDTHESLSTSNNKHSSWASVLAGISNTQLDQLPQALADKFKGIKERLQASEQLKNFFDYSSMKAIEQEVSESMAGLRELKLLDESHIAPKVASGKVIDALADTLSRSLTFEPHEQDFVLMFHRIVAEYPAKGETVVHEASLSERGTPHMSGTAKTVGLPVAIGAQLVLDGVISNSGIVRPITKDVYEPVMRELARHGIRMHETDTVQTVQPTASSA
eukprot:TRINITY_DN37660_c0_g1_i1.p1 TRINITY_DN37660_c0_g1~~TRINITY_DN37660_c0_g1_i1.p1  ORF type:complete len:962 (+),score=354.25 TRINITY_DN37660_c0_g1_i1:38-2923(+)